MDKRRIPDMPNIPPPPESRTVIVKRDAEIESIRRTLYNAIDKLNRLQRQDAELKTT